MSHRIKKQKPNLSNLQYRFLQRSDDGIFFSYFGGNQTSSCYKLNIKFCRVLLMEAQITLMSQVSGQAWHKAQNYYLQDKIRDSRKIPLMWSEDRVQLPGSLHFQSASSQFPTVGECESVFTMATSHKADVLANYSQDNSVACLSFSVSVWLPAAILSPFPTQALQVLVATLQREDSGEGLSRKGSLGFSRLVTDPAVNQLQSLEWIHQTMGVGRGIYWDRGYVGQPFFFSISVTFGYLEDWEPRPKGCVLHQVCLLKQLFRA